MEIRRVAETKPGTSGIKDAPSAVKEKPVNPFSGDKSSISYKKNNPTNNSPFVNIDTKANYKEITFVSMRSASEAPQEKNDKNINDENNKSIFKKLPITDKGLDNESDEYAFSAYPKTNQKFQLGAIKAKLESFQDISGADRGTFRLQYGNTTGDKKFNFDGASVGLQMEVKENGYFVNQNPEILLPVEKGNYFFDQRNLNLAQNNGNIQAVFSLEGVKVGVKYEKGKGFGIGTLDFHDGAITTNLLEFTKKYPYLAVPIYGIVAGGVVTGAYFLEKGHDPFNIDLANITVYSYESEKHNLRVGVSPSLTLTGADKFVDAFRVPGGAASVLYKYDDNFTMSVNGGYNPVDGAHAYAGMAMRF